MPWLLIIIVTLVILLNIRLRYLNKKNGVQYDTEQYLREDFEANFTRAGAIDPEMFILLAEKDLPFRNDYDKSIMLESELIRIQEKVKLNLNAPIIKTDIQTNMEVKKRFGAANLQTVIDGEENHTKLIQHLNRWAKRLIDADNPDDAVAVLNAAVSARSDISETYTLLYGLYACSGSAGKIEELKKAIDNLPEIAKIRVVKHIEEAEAQRGQ